MLGEIRQRRRKENHNQNTLYEKNLSSILKKETKDKENRQIIKL